jgi:hypothetical protein
MRAELLRPSDYIRAADLNGKDVTVTIKEVVAKYEMIYQGGRKEKKAVLYFEGSEKGFVLSAKVNLKAIIAQHGNETDNWVGKKITLYEDPDVMFGKEKVGGIRVRKGK